MCVFLANSQFSSATAKDRQEERSAYSEFSVPKSQLTPLFFPATLPISIGLVAVFALIARLFEGRLFAPATSKLVSHPACEPVFGCSSAVTLMLLVC